MFLYRIVRALVFALFYPFFLVRREGREKIPNEGPVLLVCNHRHWLDPVFLLCITRRHLRIMAKNEIFEKNRLLAYLFRVFGVFGVKRGETDMAAIRESVRILKNGEILLLFPEGTRNRQEGKMLPLKAGASLLAIRGQAPVVPCYISGKYRPFGKIRIEVGDPISPEEYAGKRVSSSEIKIFNEKIQSEMLALGHAELIK